MSIVQFVSGPNGHLEERFSHDVAHFIVESNKVSKIGKRKCEHYP